MDQIDRKPELEESLLERPGFLLRRCLQEAGWAFEAACTDLGLTVPQYDLLFLLFNRMEVTQDRLALALGIDRATCGLIVRNLEEKGMVERRVQPADRRKRIVKITDRGRANCAEAARAAEAAKARLFDPLTEGERKQFLGLLLKILSSNTGLSGRVPFDPLR